MKVFATFALLALATHGLVDESVPGAATPESKKTDLLISAGGQTIKISTDGRGNQAKPVVSQVRQGFKRPNVAFKNSQLRTAAFRRNAQWVHKRYRRNDDVVVEDDPGVTGDGSGQASNLERLNNLIQKIKAFKDNAGPEATSIVLDMDTVNESLYFLEQLSVYASDANADAEPLGDGDVDVEGGDGDGGEGGEGGAGGDDERRRRQAKARVWGGRGGLFVNRHAAVQTRKNFGPLRNGPWRNGFAP